MGKLTTIKNRIYNDFFMPSRMEEYERIIQKSLELGYEHITLKDYYHKLTTNGLGNKRYFLHRHDIDTDLRTAKKFFEIEKRLGIKATYYFRLSTLDFELMREIDAFGSEVGYHFEEIAQYCKDKHIKSAEKALEDLDKIKAIFLQNIKFIESNSSIKIKTVASHGDFVNRKLKITNNEITNDKQLREAIGLIAEAYDEILMNSFDIYISDKQYPTFYSPENIFDALGKYNVICMLTHPRQWESNVFVNLFENLKRGWEGFRW